MGRRGRLRTRTIPIKPTTTQKGKRGRPRKNPTEPTLASEPEPDQNENEHQHQFSAIELNQSEEDETLVVVNNKETLEIPGPSKPQCAEDNKTPVRLTSTPISHQVDESPPEDGAPTVVPNTENEINENPNIGIRKSNRVRPKKLPFTPASTPPRANVKIVSPNSEDTIPGTRHNKRRKPKKQPMKANPTKQFVPPSEDEPDVFSNTEDEIRGTQQSTTQLRTIGTVADWDRFLERFSNLPGVPHVNYFKHAPLADRYDEFFKKGRVVEMPNPFVYSKEDDINIYWVAYVVRFAGYKALMRFETFNLLPNRILWVSFFSDYPKHIGYCNKMYDIDQSCLLMAPEFVSTKFPKWGKKLSNKIAEAEETDEPILTIPSNWGDVLRHAVMERQRIGAYGTTAKCALGLRVEAMDLELLYNYKVAEVTAYVGTRVHVTYLNDKKVGKKGFWFSMSSENIHQLGWGRMIGLDVMEFRGHENARFPLDSIPPYDAELFKEVVLGMCFEARHPCYTAYFSPAVVQRIFRYGYFTADIDESRFMFHISDPCIAPCGWAKTNEIDFKVSKPEKGYWRHGVDGNNIFHWDRYFMRHPKASSIPLERRAKRPEHKFLPGMKMEAVEIATPGYLGPVTVLRVVDSLLLLHFDGWENLPRHRQWVDAESGDIFPIGYAELIAHDYQGTPTNVDPELLAKWPKPQD